MTNFSKAWRYRSKNSARRTKKGIKNETNRLNRRNGKKFLGDAPIEKLNERDVI